MIDGLLRYKLGIFIYALTNFFVFMGTKKFLAFKNSTPAYMALGLLLILETSALLAPGSEFLVFYGAIAYHVGFDNLTHFHRQFKMQTGCTPNEYRTVRKKEESNIL